MKKLILLLFLFSITDSLFSGTIVFNKGTGKILQATVGGYEVNIPTDCVKIYVPDEKINNIQNKKINLADESIVDKSISEKNDIRKNEIRILRRKLKEQMFNSLLDIKDGFSVGTTTDSIKKELDLLENEYLSLQ